MFAFLSDGEATEQLKDGTKTKYKNPRGPWAPLPKRHRFQVFITLTSNRHETTS